MDFKASISEKIKEFTESAVKVDHECLAVLLEKGGTIRDIAYVTYPGGERAMVHRPSGIGFKLETVFEQGPDAYTMRYVATPGVF